MQKVENIASKQEDTSIASTLKGLMAAHSITEAQLSRKTKIPQATLHKIITGKTPDPRISTLQTLANYFEISLDMIASGVHFSGTHTPQQTTLSIPIISWDECLTNRYLTQLNASNWENWITTSHKTPNAFGLTSKPCLEPRFPKGTIFIVDPDTEPMDGDMLIVHYPDTNAATLRELSADGPIKLLLTVGASPHQDKLTDEIRILGVVLESRFVCHS